jgi:7-cyano-7-deazaguanine synthase
VAEVYLGNHGLQEGFEQYPDTSISTEQAINSLIDVSFVNKVKVIDPFIELSKADLVKLGERLKVPFRDTFSCCEGEKQPCGKCEACRKRAEAFKEANTKDE